VAFSALFVEAILAQQNARPQPGAAWPAATAPSPPATVSSAAANWQKALVARLVCFRRYPPRASGVEGVVSLAFSVDRDGNVVDSRIVKSSGSALLDAEALDLIKRAAPLPAPPTEITDSDLSVIVPIRFSAGARPLRDESIFEHVAA
jgi:periplasmic protein TonB